MPDTTAKPVLDVPLTSKPAPRTLPPSDWDVDRWDSPMVLSIPSAYQGHQTRFAIFYIGANGITRHIQGGPIEPGPHAMLIAKGTAITANPAMSSAAERARNQAAGLEHDLDEGDLVRIDGRVYQIVDTTSRRRDPWLQPVEEVTA